MKKRIFQLEDEEPRTGDAPIKVLGSRLIVRRTEVTTHASVGVEAGVGVGP